MRPLYCEEAWVERYGGESPDILAIPANPPEYLSGMIDVKRNQQNYPIVTQSYEK